MVCKNRGIQGFLGTLWVLITMVPRKIGCLRRIWVGQVSCINSLYFLQKTIPKPTKKYMLQGKEDGPKYHFQPNFSRVGLALGSGVRRFCNHIYRYTFPNPTEFSIPRYMANILFPLEGDVEHGKSAQGGLTYTVAYGTRYLICTRYSTICWSGF